MGQDEKEGEKRSREEANEKQATVEAEMEEDKRMVMLKGV